MKSLDISVKVEYDATTHEMKFVAFHRNPPSPKRAFGVRVCAPIGNDEREVLAERMRIAFERLAEVVPMLSKIPYRDLSEVIA